MTLLAAALLLAAGVLAGAAGSAGGITSLVSYPALLLAGIPPLAANVANIVALVACWPGSALGSRPELRGRGPWLWPRALAAAAGGGAGAVLLLSTPPGAFTLVVPYLVAAGSLALLLQPRLTAWRQRGSARAGGLLLPVGLVLVSAYNGYFGAGAGVMTLALVLITAEPDLPVANALKNMLLGAGSVVAAGTFIVAGSVDWAAAVPLAAGMLAGAMIGPAITRRVPAGVLRWAVGLVGLGLAVRLWVHPG
jgi:uncharacterized protein